MNEKNAIEEIINENKSNFTMKTSVDNIYTSNSLCELRFPLTVDNAFDDVTELLYNKMELLFSYSFDGAMTSSTTNIGYIKYKNDLLYLYIVDDIRYVIGFSNVVNDVSPHEDFIDLLFKSNGELFNAYLIGGELPCDLQLGNKKIGSQIEKLFLELIIKEGMWSEIPDDIINENIPRREKKTHYRQKYDDGYETPYHDELSEGELKEISKRLFNYLKNGYR